MNQKLSKLQRMGISLMLNNIRSHGAEWLNDGFIKFKVDDSSKYCDLIVCPYDKDVQYKFTLLKEENIDEFERYQFEYDEQLNMFHVFQYDEKVVGES